MYTRRSLLLASLIAVAATGASGCGSDDCEDLCEAAKGCEAEGTPSGEDCASECADLEAISDSAGCTDQYEEFIECAVDADDVCNLEDACQLQAFSFAFCVLPYCTENPNDPACGGGTACSTTGSGFEPDCRTTSSCDGVDHALDCTAETCTCSTNGEVTAMVTNDPVAFCSDDLDARVAAADQACGWGL